MESPLTSTETSTNERQLNSKRKQTDPPDSEEEANSTEANNQDMIMEDQATSNPTQTRTSARPATPATRDNKKESVIF